MHYLFSELSTPENIYEFCLKNIFNNTTAGEIEFYTFPKADGEIGLKVVGSDYYFALIYIGDASRFKVETEKLGLETLDEIGDWGHIQWTAKAEIGKRKVNK